MIALHLRHFYTGKIIERVCIPGWWSGCAPRIPRILLAHREALTPVLVSKTPQGTSGFCSRRSTSQHCCSHWGSWRGCRGWRRLWRGKTCWSAPPPLPGSGWPQSKPRTLELPVPPQLSPRPDRRSVRSQQQSVVPRQLFQCRLSQFSASLFLTQPLLPSVEKEEGMLRTLVGVLLSLDKSEVAIWKRVKLWLRRIWGNLLDIVVDKQPQEKDCASIPS